MTVSFYAGLLLGMVAAPAIRYRLIPWMRSRRAARRNRRARRESEGFPPPTYYTLDDLRWTSASPAVWHALHNARTELAELHRRGALPDGYTIVNNDTGIPEPVLTPDDLKRIARERQGGDQ